MSEILNEAVSEKLAAIDGRLDRLFEFVKLSVSTEKIEEVSGFVIGKKKDGSPALWVYAGERLEFKLFTIWEENINQSPVAPTYYAALESGAACWPTAQAPQRSEAVSAGYYFEVDPVKAVFKTDGRVSETSGRLIYKFDRWFDGETEEAASVPQPRPQGIDYAAIRKAAANAETDEQFAKIAHPLYSDILESPERVQASISYMRGSSASDYLIVMLAIDCFCDLMRSGEGGKSAGIAAKAVYVAALAAVSG